VRNGSRTPLSFPRGISKSSFPTAECSASTHLHSCFFALVCPDRSFSPDALGKAVAGSCFSAQRGVRAVAKTAGNRARRLVMTETTRNKSHSHQAAREGVSRRAPQAPGAEFWFVCADFEVVLKEFNGEPDHVHLLVNYAPKVRLSELVNSLKGVSSRRMKQEFSSHLDVLEYQKSHGALWSASYFAGSVGGAPISILRQYIEEQNRPPAGAL
jgi:putative transposase